MNTLLRRALATVSLATILLFPAVPAAAGELRLSIANGRVTLRAKDVSVREILAEWARVGQTKIVNAEKLVGGPVTLEIVDVPEAQALDTVLRSAAGYVMAPRMAGSPGPSTYDRIMILASSRAPAVSAAATPFARPQTLVPQNQNMQDDDVEFAQPMAPNFNGPVGNQMGAPPFMPQMPQAVQQPAAPLTSPRPGMLPPQVGPQPGAVNPYLNGPVGPNGTYPTQPAQPLPPATRPGTGRGGGEGGR
jgi:hypothetical protein